MEMGAFLFILRSEWESIQKLSLNFIRLTLREPKFPILLWNFLSIEL